MKRFGIATRSPAESARLARGVALPESDLRRWYEHDGLSAAAIAKHYGCGASAIYSRLREYGIPRRTAWARQAVKIGEETLRRLYVEEDLTVEAIAERYGCSLATVSRQLKRYHILARPFNIPTYPRADFSGDLVEKAYLIGFRLGDLDIREEGQTIVVATSTTKQAQLDLLRQSFGGYGHLRETSGPHEKVWLRCGLNQTFQFLLPKSDSVPEWVLEDDKTFLAFFAGYADAEGSFRDAPIFVLRTYDVNLLQTCWAYRQRIGIRCPPPRLAVKAGYVNKAGVISRGDQWDLAVHRQTSLQMLIELLLPYLKHSKRRHDALEVLRVVEMKTKRKTEASASVLRSST